MASVKGKKCAVISCNHYSNIHKHLCFFRFPKDKKRLIIYISNTKKKIEIKFFLNRCNDWALAINRSELCCEKEISTRICSSHFNGRMFTNHMQNRLLNFAIPSLDNRSTNNILFSSYAITINSLLTGPAVCSTPSKLLTQFVPPISPVANTSVIELPREIPTFLENDILDISDDDCDDDEDSGFQNDFNSFWSATIQDVSS